MIEIYSFEEWDAAQPQDRILEWGSTGQEGIADTATYNEAAHKDAPLEIRKLFYAEYVHANTYY
jgi:hypothetical protein